MAENQCKRATNDVNEYIFLLQKYSNAQNNLLDQSKDMISKYKREQENTELNDKRDIRQKTRLQEAQTDAIPEAEHEFSQVTESVNDPYGTHYTAPWSTDDVESAYKKKDAARASYSSAKQGRFQSENIAKSVNDGESDDGSQMQVDRNHEILQS